MVVLKECRSRNEAGGMTFGNEVAGFSSQKTFSRKVFFLLDTNENLAIGEDELSNERISDEADQR